MDMLLPESGKQFTYEKYLEEYETPYQYNPQLAGDWKGTIKAYEKELPISLQFPRDGSVNLQIGSQESRQLEQVIFNRHGLLNAYFTGPIPFPQYKGEGANQNELIVYLVEGQLMGHIASSLSNEKGAFRYGPFTKLQRE